MGEGEYMSKRLEQYFYLVLGSTLLTLGIWLFVTPNQINFGGMIGLAQLIDYFIHKFLVLPKSLNTLGMINLLMNIPLFIFGYKIMNKEFCFKTIISLIIQTVLLSILPAIKEPIVEDALLNVAFAAIICGIGVGLALRSSGCCGGIDIATVCLVKKNPDFRAGQLSIIFNVVLFGICLFIYDIKIIMYSIVFVAILYTTADKFHLQNINVAVLIFTKNKEIKEAIMKQMGRGVTYWMGKGAYTETDQEILYVAINKYEIQQLNKIVSSLDPKAFVTLAQGPMVHGGFEKRL